MKAVGAYIFDMDGTLVDNCGYHVTSWQAFARRYGHELTERQILDWMGAQGSFYMAQIFQRPIPADELARLCAEKEAIYRELAAPHLAVPAGLRAFLDAAHAQGIPCAIATGGPKENVDFVLDTLDLRKDFSVIVDSTMYTHSKPDPECFLTAAARLGVEPSRCQVFEDAVNGIQAAHAAGMRVTVITFTNPRATLAAAHPDRIIDSYCELLADFSNVK